MQKSQVLILCTGNSCRSQMAEGIVRHLYGESCDVFSAGTHPSFVHPTALKVLAEIGIDGSSQESTSVNEFQSKPMDIVVTVCDAAKENCPVFFNSAKQLHWSFSDPAAIEGSEDYILNGFRTIRDEILVKFRMEFGQYLQEQS